MDQVSLVPILLWVAALICAGIAIWRAPRPITFSLIVDKLLRYLFIFPLGVQGLWGFLGHVFFAEETANSIGWEPSPFQYEVGVANLGLGLASFYAAFRGFEARTVTAVMAACFLAGAGVGHLIDIAQGDNLAPGNAGPILYTDFLTPIAILVLLLMCPRRSERTAAERVAKAPASSSDRHSQTALQGAPRIEEELEKARKSMRESLKAGPTPEVLPPMERPHQEQPPKGKQAVRKSLTDLSET